MRHKLSRRAKCCRNVMRSGDLDRRIKSELEKRDTQNVITSDFSNYLVIYQADLVFGFLCTDFYTCWVKVCLLSSVAIFLTNDRKSFAFSVLHAPQPVFCLFVF